MSGGGSGGGTTTTNTNSVPWGGQQPALSQLYSSAQNLYSNPSDYPQYYPSATYAPINSAETAPLQTMYNMAMSGGTPAMAADQSFLSSMLAPGATAQSGTGFGQATTALEGQLGPNSQIGASTSALSPYLSGSFLNPATNPGFQTVVNNTMASVMPSITSGFNNGNRLDSGLATEAASQGATNAVGGLELQNFQNNQALQQQAAAQTTQNAATGAGLQQQAASDLASNYLNQQANQTRASMFLPSADAQYMSDLQNATSLGSVQQQNQQAGINAGINQWNYNQALPWNMASLYSGLVNNGLTGTAATMTQPYYHNTAAGVLGGGLSGAAAGAVIGSAVPGIGTGIGAVAGGLLGGVGGFL